MQIDEILIIKHDNISYGITTSAIEQIRHVPELTPLVLSPKEIVGLSAMGGSIRTVLDVNLLLGIDAVDSQSPLSRLLTLTGTHAHMALLISEVVESIVIDQEKIEYIDTPEDAIVAIYRHHGDIVQVFELERLFKDVILKRYESSAIKENTKELNSYLEKSDSSSQRYLLFKMADERYALKIDFLREIINMPETFTELAGSRAEIEGMIQLRDELLVVADLRRSYGFDEKVSEKNRILVAQYGGKYIGLIIDEILDIRDFLASQVDGLPENFKDKKLSGIIHSDEQLIAVIGEEILAEMITANEKLLVGDEIEMEDAESAIALEVVIFKIGEEEYAIDIEEVSSIIDALPLTQVPDAPELIDGIINIRGQVVAVSSLHKRLNAPFDDDEELKIIVCENGKERIGFRVDSVSDVMGIHADAIRAEEERGELVTDVLHLDDGARLVLLLNMERLFNSEKVQA